MLRFHDDGHKYESVTPDGRKWLGVTTLISKFKIPFDPAIAYKNVKDPESKWYGMDPIEVQRIWKTEANRSTTVGTWFHKYMEDREKDPINCCPIKEGWKYAGDQILQPGVYPEFFVYNSYYGLCGQADKVEATAQGTINIGDYKTNKKLEMKGFRGKKMLSPIQHLEDCHFSHYSLQMSFYMWMLLQHNYWLKPGTMTLYHVKFKIEDQDENGYPIVAKNKNGEYVYESVNPIVVPYLKDEVESILASLQVYPH